MNTNNSIEVDELKKPYFVWFEENWMHDDILHKHKKGQLVYVESGFQYITIEERIYLLPQNHAVWIPPGAIHKTNSHSEKIKLMIMFADMAGKGKFLSGSKCVFCASCAERNDQICRKVVKTSR